MKLFSRHRNRAEPAENTFELVTPAAPKVVALPALSLSAEQKDMLGQPLDPRVGRIMDRLYADKTAAERALNHRQIVAFPASDSGERHVVQDADGFWRIVPAPTPEQNRLFDAL